jgi:uncharacterized membrane protein
MNYPFYNNYLRFSKFIFLLNGILIILMEPWYKSKLINIKNKSNNNTECILNESNITIEYLSIELGIILIIMALQKHLQFQYHLQ